MDDLTVLQSSKMLPKSDFHLRDSSQLSEV